MKNNYHVRGFNFLLFCFSVISIALLNGCTQAPPSTITTITRAPTTPYSQQQDGYPTRPPTDLNQIPNAVPKAEPLSRYGNPASYAVNGTTYHVLASARGYDVKGIGSFYGTKFQGHRTSSGEAYDMYGMTAASPDLPLPTYVIVTNLQNDKQVIVKVNDRGPFHPNRVIDLTYTAAYKLGMFPKGTALVEVKAIDPNTWHGHLNQQARTPKHQPVMYLQLAAFANQDNANRLVAKAKAETSLPVFIRTEQAHARTWYKVQVGPIPNIESADYLVAKLSNQHLGKPFTVVY